MQIRNPQSEIRNGPRGTLLTTTSRRLGAVANKHNKYPFPGFPVLRRLSPRTSKRQPGAVTDDPGGIHRPRRAFCEVRLRRKPWTSCVALGSPYRDSVSSGCPLITESKLSKPGPKDTMPVHSAFRIRVPFGCSGTLWVFRISHGFRIPNSALRIGMIPQSAFRNPKWESLPACQPASVCTWHLGPWTVRPFRIPNSAFRI